MRGLGDDAVERLRQVADLPDGGTGRYRVVRRVASGGMGTVYAAVDEELGREVALKVLTLEDGTGGLEERMRREARVLARLEHPNVVPVHDVGRLPDGRPFYVMKLVRGRRLDEWLAQGRGRAEVLRVWQRVCEAVAFAHANGVVHRDLKPANVLLGDLGEVLVADWGVAKVLGGGGPGRGGATDGPAPAHPRSGAADGVTADGAVLGTPGHMAPEQARGETHRVGPASDVYALGAMLRLVLAAPAPDERAATRVPRRLDAICRKALAPEPADRYPTARELVEDLSRFLEDEPVAALPEGPLARAVRFVERHREVVLLVCAYLVARSAVFLLAQR